MGIEETKVELQSRVLQVVKLQRQRDKCKDEIKVLNGIIDKLAWAIIEEDMKEVRDV